jgi:hypothetical protein
MALCKVYHDGSHYVATVVVHNDEGEKRESRLLGLIDLYFHFHYLESMKQCLKGAAQLGYIKSALIEKFGEDGYDWDTYITKKIELKLKSLYERKKRFRRKAFLNDWNYFVTITYDDAKQTAESFLKKLKKCLSNLHTRHGWKYMGVFELSPTGRIHFHALVYVPRGEMVGTIEEVRDYSFKDHKMQIRHENSFFFDRFGVNDFDSIEKFQLKHGRTIDYLLKYLGKTDEKIVYSRGIPTFLFLDLTPDDISVEMYDFVVKYVLFDDVISSDDGDDGEDLIE